jgi:hypothetical protein
LFGLEEQLLDPMAPGERAIEALLGEAPDANLIELAELTDRQDPRQLVERLAAGEQEQSLEEIRVKWLWLVLSWIFAHRNQYRDPLRKVEEVYADFGYPDRIAGFVRYMPSDVSSLAGREANEARLYERWRNYIEEGARLYCRDGHRTV